MPEVLWKAYIDFEISEGERERARHLYERLIQLSGHVKVWIAYALFEGEAIPVPRDEREEDEDDDEAEVKMAPGDPITATTIFRRAYNDLKNKKLIDEVCLQLQSAQRLVADSRNSACGLARSLENIRGKAWHSG